MIAFICNYVTKLCEKSEKSITFKNKKTGVAFISPYVELLEYWGTYEYVNDAQEGERSRDKTKQEWGGFHTNEPQLVITYYWL